MLPVTRLYIAFWASLIMSNIYFRNSDGMWGWIWLALAIAALIIDNVILRSEERSNDVSVEFDKS